MAFGFIGKLADEYFIAVSDAVKKASTLSGVSAAMIPDGTTGGYSLNVGNPTNIVVDDGVYKSELSRIVQSDEAMAERILNVIRELEDACENIFIIPRTTAGAREVLDEVKRQMQGFGAYTTLTNHVANNYLAKMQGIDGWPGARAFNESLIQTHKGTCDRAINEQIKGLENERTKLQRQLDQARRSLDAARRELSSAQSALTSARSALSRAQSMSTGTPEARSRRSAAVSSAQSNISSAQARITNAQNQIAALEQEIVMLEAQIQEIEECIEYMQETLTKTGRMIENIISNTQTADQNHAVGIERQNDGAGSYINHMRGIGDSIGMPFAAINAVLSRITCDDTVEALYKALEGMSEQDRHAILYIVCAAPEPYRGLFLMFADKINITDFYAVEVVNGQERRIAMFFPGDQTIILNMDRPDAYSVFFHEIGHMIDYFLIEGNLTYFTNKESPSSKQLFDSLRLDVQRQLINLAMELGYEFTIARELASNIMSGNKVVDARRLTPMERQQLALQNAMNARLKGGANPNFDAPNKTINNMNYVSDVYGGMTNNAVVGEWGHRPDPNDTSWYDYWFDENMNPTHMQQLELFAGNFSAGMRKDDDALANQNHYFPSGSAVLGDIINDMENRIGGAQ